MNCAGNFPKFKLSWSARTDRENASEDGWALISVLYVVAMLALLAAATEALLLTSAELDRRVWDRARADAALDAAVTRSVLGLTDSRMERRWRVDGAPATFDYGGVPVEVSVQDQLGLIDLNAADGSMLKRLLQACGQTEDAATKLTDAILDWRSAKTEQSFDDAYAAAGISWHPRHGPFQSVAELRLVRGMTPELFRKLEPAITIYNGHPAFEPDTAPETALRALYLDRPDEVAKKMAERNGGNAQTGVLSSTLSLAGRAFAVKASITIDSRTYRRQTVILLTDDPKRPFLTLAWN
jgi:general secretion pathway protein K